MSEVQPLISSSGTDEENGKIEVNDVYGTNGDSSRKSTPKEQRDVIAELFFQTRSLQRQHNLAYVHYRNLEWFLHSNPLIILSLTSGILAFLASTGGQKDGSFLIPGTNGTYFTPNADEETPSLFSSGTRQMFAIIVGVLSFVQLAIQKLGESWNFASRSDMHLQVATGLDRLLNKIMVEEKIWHGSHEDEYKTASADIQRWQEVFEQCLSSCSSPLPLKLRQAFKMLESQLPLHMLANGVTHNYDIHDRQQRQLLYSHAFNELFLEITDSCWWPLFFIKPKKAVTNVMRNFDNNCRK